MDALTRKHVPEDVGLRNTGEGELGPVYFRSKMSIFSKFFVTSNL